MLADESNDSKASVKERSGAFGLLEEFDLLGNVPMFALTAGRGPGAIKGKYRAPNAWGALAEQGGDDYEALTGAAAVGAATGYGLDVIDIDYETGGVESLAALADDGLIPPVHHVVATPSGGFHLYVDTLDVSNSASMLAPGVDVRAKGGFAFMPPTPGYRLLPPEEWPDLGAQSDGAAARLRARLIRGAGDVAPEELEGDPSEEHRRAAQGLLNHASKRVAQAEEGTRNDTLNSQAHLMYRFALGGCLEEDQVTEVLTAAAHRCGLPKIETASTLESALDGAEKHGATRPAVSTPADDFEVLPEVPAETSPSAEPTAEERHERAVAKEVHRLRIQQEARERFRRENLPELPPFDIGTLGEVLARPADPPDRVEGLIKTDGSTLVVAQRKTGKTTLMLNLARSLITGEDFLGRFATRPIVGNVALLNFEVSAQQVARDAARVGVDPDRLTLVNLRGTRNPFTSPEALQALGEQLRERNIETLIVDPFGRAYSGENQNDNGEVTRWLVGLDEFARAVVGARDLVLVAHAGWEGERARGASALEDWADSILWIRRGTGASESTRYFKAEGRGVDVHEDEISFDPATQHLALTGKGSRREASKLAAMNDVMPEVLDYIKSNPGASQREITREVVGKAEAIRAALKQLIDDGYVIKEKEGQAHRHYSKDTPRPTASPPRPGRGAITASPRPTPFRGDGRGRDPEESATASRSEGRGSPKQNHSGPQPGGR